MRYRAMDSDGYIGLLIPIWIEAGFNGYLAGRSGGGQRHPLQFRDVYGRQIAYGGGIDKRAIAAGAGDPARPSCGSPGARDSRRRLYPRLRPRRPAGHLLAQLCRLYPQVSGIDGMAVGPAARALRAVTQRPDSAARASGAPSCDRVELTLVGREALLGETDRGDHAVVVVAQRQRAVEVGLDERAHNL